MDAEQSSESASVAVTASVIPAHGHGRLLPGGKPGNKSGPGRTADKIRRMLRQGLKGSAPALNRMAAGEVLVPCRISCEACGVEPQGGKWLEGVYAAVQKASQDQIRAIEVQLRYGIGVPSTITLEAVQGYSGALWSAIEHWADTNKVDPAALDSLRQELQGIARDFGKQHRK